jgi:hypothetical protein
LLRRSNLLAFIWSCFDDLGCASHRWLAHLTRLKPGYLAQLADLGVLFSIAAGMPSVIQGLRMNSSLLTLNLNDNELMDKLFRK